MTGQTVASMDSEVGEKQTRRLYWWLLLALFLEYARPASYFPVVGLLPLNSVVPLLLFVVCLFAKGLRPAATIFSDRFSRYLLVFVGLIAISILHADVTRNAYDVFKLVLGYVFLFFAIVRIATTQARIKGIFAVLILSHLFLIYMNPLVVTDPTIRHYILGATFLGDGNDFSLSICILIPFTLELVASANSRWKKFLWFAVLLVLAAAVIGTQSRGAALGMGAMVAYFWFVSRRKAVGVMVVLLIGVVVAVYAPGVYFERMGSITNYQEDGSAMGRIEAWKAGVRMAADNPVLGVGAGHYPIAFGTKYRPPGLSGTPWLTAHSMYFLVLGELGFPGIFVVLSLVFGNILENRRIRKLVISTNSKELFPGTGDSLRLLRLLTGSMVGFSVAAAFLSVAYYPHLFVLTALLVAGRSLALKTVGMSLESGAKPFRGRSLAQVVQGKRRLGPQSPEARIKLDKRSSEAATVRRSWANC